jgi:uncharacterized protein (DUF305 family)
MRTIAIVWCALAAVGCRSAQGTAGAPVAAAAVAGDTVRRGYAAADVRFMQGMIGHHAQAVAMARWAATHGASARVRTLAERIDVSQRDEIALMQRWLRERGERVPEPSEHQLMGHASSASGEAPMPGMLTAEEMQQLDAARGAEFDRLFLTRMIRHHEGAVAMVRALFASPGAAQEASVYRLASDVEADQVAEIRRMRELIGP